MDSSVGAVSERDVRVKPECRADSDSVPLRRVLLKLSGEFFGGDAGQGLDSGAFGTAARQIRALRRTGIEVAVVVGGGNIFRGRVATEWRIDELLADEVGMLATGVNAKALAAALERDGVPACVVGVGPCEGIGISLSEEKMDWALRDGDVVILAGGSGRPGVSTDVPAVELAQALSVDLLIFTKHGVDAVYEADPADNPDALPLEEVTFDDALRRRLGVMDEAALRHLAKTTLQVRVISAGDEIGLLRLVNGGSVGTLMRP
jgi:uridylate kinase